MEVSVDDNLDGTGSESEREKIEAGREPIKFDLEVCTAQSVLITRSDFVRSGVDLYPVSLVH